jgi:hypothetical protein
MTIRLASTVPFSFVCWSNIQIHILDSLSWSAVVSFEYSNRVPAGVVRLSILDLSVTHDKFTDDMAWTTKMARSYRRERISILYDSPWLLTSSQYATIFYFSDERVKAPQSITHYQTKSDPTKANPKTGVAQLEWNQTGTLLLVRFGMRLLLMLQPLTSYPFLYHIFA